MMGHGSNFNPFNWVHSRGPRNQSQRLTLSTSLLLAAYISPCLAYSLVNLKGSAHPNDSLQHCQMLQVLL